MARLLIGLVIGGLMTGCDSWDVVAEGPDGEQVIFRVAGSEDILDEDTAERILDTLSFK